jgi:acetolactate synthase-1/3 small subunit
MVKVEAGSDKRQAIIATSSIFRAKVVDISTDSMMIELTGNQSKVDAFINLLGDVKILEMVRTGVTGLLRGSGDMSELFED